MNLRRPCAQGRPHNGAFCPRVLNDPQTVEGRAALRLALSPGIWRRAGMEAVLSGIDWTAARSLAEGVARGLRWGAVAALLARFETGALLGEARRRKKDKDNEEES